MTDFGNGPPHLHNHASAASGGIQERVPRSGPFFAGAREDRGKPFLVEPPAGTSDRLWFPLGRTLFAVSLLAFGVEEFQYSGQIGDLGLVPGWFPGHLHLMAAWCAGILLLAGGVAILVGFGARAGTAALGAVFLVAAFVRFPPQQAGIAHSVVDRTVFFHLISCCGGCWMLTGLFAEGRHGGLRVSRPGLPASAGRILFGLSVVVYGLDHFAVAHFIALLIPRWIPFHGFFAWFTGFAMVAAGLAMMARIRMRAAAGLLALMFFLWVWMIQVPEVVHAPHDSDAWNSVFIALAMAGCALLAAALAGGREVGSGG